LDMKYFYLALIWHFS